MTNTQANGSFLSKIFSQGKTKCVFSETAPYFIEFPKDNTIRYGQDFGWHACIPHGVKFYPERTDYHSVYLIGDRHGICRDNPYGLKGEYGNGLINIPFSCLPKAVEEWCKTHLLTSVVK